MYIYKSASKLEELTTSMFKEKLCVTLGLDPNWVQQFIPKLSSRVYYADILGFDYLVMFNSDKTLMSYDRTESKNKSLKFKI